MYIESLQLVNYKNIENEELQFSPKLNCFLGDNGVGKTNLLDAIYTLSFCKSFFNTPDSKVMMHDKEFYLLQGSYIRDEKRAQVSCGVKKGAKKVIKYNKKAYQKITEHIGLLPLVMISPSDHNLILGGSDERRKFLDGVISQYDRVYLEKLIRYNRTVAQRNQLLKQCAIGRYVDEDMLFLYDEQLNLLAEYLHSVRAEFITTFIPVFNRYYSAISGNRELVSLTYVSDLFRGDLISELKSVRTKELALGYTTLGVHKDDLKFMLGDHEIKKIGSQGQNKTYLIALKLAQFEVMKEINGVTPIVLLDDIFDKLDSYRVEQIIGIVSQKKFGQIFITDTNREHIEHIFPKLETDSKIFRIDKGVVQVEG